MDSSARTLTVKNNTIHVDGDLLAGCPGALVSLTA